MSTTIHNVKGSELPASWRKQASVAPDDDLRITIDAEADTDDGLMPPEEDFSDEMIAADHRSDEEVKAGLSVRLRSKKERKEFFEQIKNE